MIGSEPAGDAGLAREAAGYPGTVVILSSVHWHFTWQHHQTLAFGLLQRGYKVLWVEPMPKRWPRAAEWRRILGRLRGDLIAAGGVPQRVPEGLEILNPRMIPERGRLSSRINRRLLLSALEGELRRRIVRPLVLLHYLPLATALELHRRLDPEFAVYGRFCEWRQDPLTAATALHEAEMADTVDVVLVESGERGEGLDHRSTPVTLVPPAVDFELFHRAARSEPRQDAPLCIYFGLISDRLDFALLSRLCDECRVRLIGPRQGDLSALDPRIEVMGPVPQDRLPELLAPADVLLLPYRRIPFHDGLVPAKTFECLATGKPVIAAGLPALATWEGLLRLVSDSEELMSAVAAALQEPGEAGEARIEFARGQSLECWLDRIEALWLTVRAEPPLAPVSSGDGGSVP